MTQEKADEAMAEELEIGETSEIAPGVVVERRCFLRSVAFSSLALQGAVRLVKASDERLSYEEFIKRWCQSREDW